MLVLVGAVKMADRVVREMMGLYRRCNLLEVKINKEIRNYTESMFFGLSLRQFIFSALACGVAVGLFFLLRPHFGTETLSWVCILGASMPKKLMFLPDNLYHEALKPNIEAREKGLPVAQKKQKRQTVKAEKKKPRKSKKRKEADYDKNA